MKNPNGFQIEDLEFAADQAMDDYIAEQEAKQLSSVRHATCAVCNVEWVDVVNGEDTCLQCRSKV